MKWQIAWIALIAACVLIFGGLIYAELAGLILARSTREEVEILAQGHHLIGSLWPLVAAGVLVSAIPAWTFIVWMFVQLREEDHNTLYQRLETARTALQEAKQQIACAQACAAESDQGREWLLSQREAALAQAEREVQQRQRQAEQEAARQIEVAQTRAEVAELRAQRATNAFQRVKRKYSTN